MLDSVTYRRATWHIHKYRGDDVSDASLLDVVEFGGNLLMYGGASALWERLIGTGVTAYDNTNAYLGVGDSTTVAAATQTDLQASTNKLRKAMDSTYPQHTDGTASGNASIVFRSTFGTSDANFSWQEFGLFNASTSGRMLNRKVADHGSKTTDTWVLSLTLSAA
jgi:hypothetical protein